MKIYLLALGLFLQSCSSSQFSVDSGWESVQLDVAQWHQKIANEYDTDKDQKITVKDSNKNLTLENGAKLRGHYPISVLMQELEAARLQGQSKIILLRRQLTEHPLLRVSHQITDHYWNGLTRSMDQEGLEKVLQDPKAQDAKYFYLYTPYSDPQAFYYFSSLATKIKSQKKIIVKRLPKDLNAADVRMMDGKHGLLTLKPGSQFVVPGGRFNEMYGWDSYFIILGLLRDGKIELAKSMVENLSYQIQHYGKILNANRSYYLTRSQPPFTTRAIWAVYEMMPKNQTSRAWFAEQMKWALKEYRQVWMSAPRLTELGLSRYYDEGRGPCPEVEPGHYDHVYHSYAREQGKTAREYGEELMEKLRLNPKAKMPEELELFFKHDRAVRESGHDTTYRFDQRTADFLPVDLNSLLAMMESDFEQAVAKGLLSAKEFGSADEWKQQLNKRKKLIHKFLWDEDKDLYFDWDMKNYRRSGYVTATTFYPLWAKLVEKTHAIDLVNAALPKLEQAGGVSGSDKFSPGTITPYHPQRQWDYPYGWAPHQMILWKALDNYQMHEHKNRLISKWLKMIASLARDYNGVVPEKYDVVSRTHLVFAEYGNVGVDFSYITQEGFGWMNASYQIGLDQLDQHWMNKLMQEVK